MKKEKNKLSNIFKNPKKSKCLIVAEISANHGGKLSRVLKIIDKAKDIGIDAIKLQLYKADIITLDSKKNDFRINSKNSWSKYKTMYNLYSQAQTPYEWYDKINKFCKKNNLILFSSVFDKKTVNFLEKNNCPIYKIASPEITDIPLIERVAKTKKPVFLSTGLSTYQDIRLALNTLKKNNCNKIVLMKCTSSYPAPSEEINLRTMLDFKKRFNVTVGYSDHTTGINASITAAALGAKVIEKHITLNKKGKTVDSFFSSDLNEFKNLVDGVRSTEKNLGIITYSVSKSSKKNLSGRKSIYVIKEIKKNEVFNEQNISCIRPSFGLHPKYYKSVLGKRSKKNLQKGQRLKKIFINFNEKK